MYYPFQFIFFLVSFMISLIFLIFFALFSFFSPIMTFLILLTFLIFMFSVSFPDQWRYPSLVLKEFVIFFSNFLNVFQVSLPTTTIPLLFQYWLEFLGLQIPLFRIFFLIGFWILESQFLPHFSISFSFLFIIPFILLLLLYFWVSFPK